MSEIINESKKESPLIDVHRESGAHLGQSFGWEMPEYFSDPVEEHFRVRSSAGLFDLSYCGAVRIGGKEGAQFLNGLVTNDVKSLQEGQGVRAAFLTGHGKVRAFCTIYGLGEEYLIINDPHTHEKVYKYVFPFSYAGDFKVEDVSEGHRLLSVQGPNSIQVMKEVCFEPIPTLENHNWTRTLIAGYRVIAARESHTGEIGYDILVPSEGLKDVWDFILLKGAFHEIAPVGSHALNSLRIEAGLPIYGVDADESNMMLETGLLEAVSYTKGCYTGQEAVAMATYRGHVSKKLAGLVVASEIPPPNKAKIFKEGKEIGYITSSLKSETLGSVIALGYLKYGHFEPGTPLEVESPDGLNQASVVELPFYRASADKT
ncbi:MAG TPA: aminomethyltransferase family protein [Blastocatellia bacterium]|nr:aminomethyltransferase family protein [Blastocatellia bacterium]